MESDSDQDDREKKMSKLLLRKTYKVTIIMLIIGQIQVSAVMEM